MLSALYPVQKVHPTNNPSEYLVSYTASDGRITRGIKSYQNLPMDPSSTAAPPLSAAKHPETAPGSTYPEVLVQLLGSQSLQGLLPQWS